MKYALGWAVALGLAGCGGDSGAKPPPIDGTDATTLTGGPTTMGDTAETMATGTEAESGASTGEPPTNCAELQCSGPGSCQTAANGEVFCACDEGYTLADDMTTCVVDETCIQVRFLEDHCRQAYAGPPAVSLFFGVDFCAGTAVTPDKIPELGISFQILENDVDVEENVESSVSVIDVDVENYVNLVIDVSDSLTNDDEFLPGLVEALHGLVDALEPQAGEPDVYMGIHVFARGVAEYVPFTRDLDTIRSALDVVLTDPESVVDLAGGGMGTDLFAATKEAIENTQRIRELRDGVTWGGVLSTGTVVVVSDGDDASNGTLDQGLIERTVNQVISVGLGDDIMDMDLQRIGRDGNFLAPTAQDLADAFAAITTRVKEYPLRSYMLAYCSSTTEGTPVVEVKMQGGALSEVRSAACQFDADLFSTQAFECNEDLFKNECNTLECGGLTGCGACPDDECCTGGVCASPISISDAGVSCAGQAELCEEDVELCNDVGDCVEAAQPGMDYGAEECPPGCAPGYVCEDVKMMSQHECVPGLSLGSPCSEPSECASLNCYYVDEDNPFEGRRCLPQARIFDHCGADDAVCEVGAWCQGSTCQARKLDAVPCGTDAECRHAVCVEFEGGNFCSGPAACYWSWEEKLPS